MNLPSGDLVNTVDPGNEITFVLAATNTGPSPADDVYIEDHFPDGTVLVSPGNSPVDLSNPLPNEKAAHYAARLNAAVTFGLTTKSEAASHLTVSLDAANHFIRIGGIHLDPKNAVVLRYTVQVLAGGSAAPAVGETIEAGASTIGTSSTPHTPPGFPAQIPIEITGQAAYSIQVAAALTCPGTTSDVASTANVLAQIYKKDPSSLPVVANSNRKAAPQIVPGNSGIISHMGIPARSQGAAWF